VCEQTEDWNEGKLMAFNFNFNPFLKLFLTHACFKFTTARIFASFSPSSNVWSWLFYFPMSQLSGRKALTRFESLASITFNFFRWKFRFSHKNIFAFKEVHCLGKILGIHLSCEIEMIKIGLWHYSSELCTHSVTSFRDLHADAQVLPPTSSFIYFFVGMRLIFISRWRLE
jgi:hypothetical protein